jgi:predicted metal-dependent peptidase
VSELPGLGAARLWAARNFPYLATGLFGAEVVAAPGSGTVSVDRRWRLRADPAVSGEWSAAELGSVLVHHVCHLLRDHSQRAEAARVAPADSPAWIRAADAEINDDLILAGLELPGDPVQPSDFGAPDGKLAEEYFGLLKDKGDGGSVPPAPGGPGADGGTGSPPQDGMGGEQPGSGPGGTVGLPRGGTGGEHPPRGGTGGEQPPVSGGIPGGRPPGATWLDCGSGADGQPRDGDDDGGLDDWQADLLRRQVAQEVERAGKEPGKVPAGLLRWAREVLSPRIDWRRLLAAELRRAVADVAGAADYSYRRPSRRASAVPSVVLPALRRPVPELAVVCDTSGSMSEELLAMALAEVEGLLRGLGLARRLRVLACDTAVGPAQRVTSARQVSLVGGGGTNMGTGIAAACALRPRPAVCVVLTDGYTPWPHEAPKGMRVVVGLLGSDPPEAPSWARSVRVTAD